MLAYPATIEYDPEGESWIVSFPDLPGGYAEGETEQEARDLAEEAAILRLQASIADRDEITTPGIPVGNQVLVPLPSAVASKILLYQLMLSMNVNKSELARRMDARQSTVDRLLDLFHHSRMDVIDRALEALGSRMDVSLRRIA